MDKFEINDMVYVQRFGNAPFYGVIVAKLPFNFEVKNIDTGITHQFIYAGQMTRVDPIDLEVDCNRILEGAETLVAKLKEAIKKSNNKRYE